MKETKVIEEKDENNGRKEVRGQKNIRHGIFGGLNISWGASFQLKEKKESEDNFCYFSKRFSVLLFNIR